MEIYSLEEGTLERRQTAKQKGRRADGRRCEHSLWLGFNVNCLQMMFVAKLEVMSSPSERVESGVIAVTIDEALGRVRRLRAFLYNTQCMTEM